MKKLIQKKWVLSFIAFFFIFLSSASAANYIVSGAGETQLNGTYVETSTWNGKPLYIFNNNGNQYAIGFEEDRWMIGDWMDGMLMGYYQTMSTNPTPPSTGWMGELTVMLEGKSLSYSTLQFIEHLNNDGSIANSIVITYNEYDGDAFTGEINDDFIASNKVTVSNVPAGLTASIIKTAGNQLTISITGNASNHERTDRINNIALTFQDAAFYNGNAASVGNYNKSDIGIQYIIFTVGHGTFENPHQIATLADLRFLSENSNYGGSGTYFIQTADIDATETNTWNVGDHDGDAETADVAMGFSPIENFMGSYDGQGHTISNLNINRPAKNYLGLFSTFSSSSTVSNIGLTNVFIVGYDRVGGLIGESRGTVTSCFSTGSVKGNWLVGGLVGLNYAGISKSYSNANAEGNNDVGGLIGQSWEGSISNSYATGSVKGNSGIAGFIGHTGPSVTIDKCYAVGLVNGNIGVTSAGGFIGASNNASVTSSYWDSQTSGQSTSAAGSSKTTLEMKTVGTYTGWDFETTPIWQIDANNNNGYPYLAWQTPEIDLKQSATAIANGSGTYGFGNKDVNTNTDVIFTIQNTGAAVSTLSNFTITGTNANQFSMQGTAPTTVAAGASVTFTVRFSPTSVGAKTATIAFDNQDANENPYSFDVTGTGAFSGGAGTVGSPYQIATLADLRFLSENSGYWSSDKYYIQTADIDATETNTWNVGNHDGDAGTANVAMGFVCIGNSSAFNGKYDGKGYVISNLYINRPLIDYVGLFGYINSQYSTISNLGITNVNVVGRDRVGGLVGWNNQGIITNTYTTGVVKGRGNVGGLIGNSNYASISKSYSTASTEGVDAVGGLNGQTWAGRVENSYAIGSVKGNAHVGGLIGYIGGNGSSLVKSYAVGVVTGNSNVGGLVGTNDPTRATATNSYWDYQTTGQATSVLGSGKTTLEMKTQATYIDWDFATTPIWKINSVKNSGYPYLTWQAIQITTNKNSSTLNLSGNSNIEVASGVTLTLDGNATINSLILAPTAKLTLGSNTLNAPNGVVLQSSADGTATILGDNPVSNATVQQYVTAGRNWYMSTPINNTSPVTSLSGGVSVQQYDEINGAWVIATGTLMRGKGYVQVASAGQGTTGAVSFNGTTNSGDVGIALTNNSGGGKGFNLVGNPYPSYLSWSAVAADNSAANMPTGTMWYRTISYNGKSAWAPNIDYSLNDIVYNGTRFYKVTSAGKSAASGGPTGGLTNIVDNTVVWKYEGSIYLFATVNASGVASPSNLVTVSNLVPPMQSFWVKSNGGTLTFKNSMRTHNTGGTNGLKAPKNAANDLQLLRLNITNGVSTDEAVIYVSTNASNAFDTYDAPKYFNVAGSNQPEIYTQVGAEKLVINAMSELMQGTEIPLGFATEKVNNFSISASEFRNFDSDMEVVLKDKQTKTEFYLNDGKSYTFSSDVVNDTNRFILIFRTAGTTTGAENALMMNAQVFVNEANQISIIAPEKSNYAIYNAVGQLIEKGVLNTKHETRNTQLTSGVYFVELSVNGQSEVKKVFIR